MITTTYQANAYVKDGEVSRKVFEGFCLSTDTKPTDGVWNGSILIEMDTKKVCVFDEDNTTWREL